MTLPGEQGTLKHRFLEIKEVGWMNPDLGQLWRVKDLSVELPRRALGRLGFGHWAGGHCSGTLGCCRMQRD